MTSEHTTKDHSKSGQATSVRTPLWRKFLPVSILFLILTTVFVATTGDSMTFAISSALSKEGEPSGGMRAFWGLVMAAMAIVLVSAGNGGGAVGKLQQFIVITGAPVSLMLLPSLWDAPRIALKLMRETQS